MSKKMNRSGSFGETKKDTNKGEKKKKKWEKGGKRVMESQEETVRADGEQADKWREWVGTVY